LFGLLGQSPERQVIIPVGEIEICPDTESGVPSSAVNIPVNVPLGLTVSVIAVIRGVGPEDKKVASQLPAKSAGEYEAARLVKIVRLELPSLEMCVHTRTVLPESIRHKGVFETPPPVIIIPSVEIEKAPLRLSGLPLLSLPEPVNVPSGLTVRVPLSHQGAEGLETKLL
jgi:hypothetical protein